mgnify:CR=1 FL=1
MKIYKKLMTLILVMLALTACHDRMDEPTPDLQNFNILMTAHGSGMNGDLIYNIQGDTVYECEQWWSINLIESEGKDWYAVIGREDENNHLYHTVIKNGGPDIFSTYDYVSSMQIDHGDIYLMQFNDEQHPNQIWITKNSRLIYSVEDNNVFSPRWMRVKDGDVVLTGPARSGRACYWKNGKLIDIPGVEGPMELGCWVAWEGNDELIGFSMDKNGHSGYMLNGKRKDLDLERIHHVEFINGKPFIVGQKFVKELGFLPVTVIGDDAYVLSQQYGSYVMKMEKRSNSAFYYVTCGGNRFYKDLMSLDMPAKVSQIGINDFTILER